MSLVVEPHVERKADEVTIWFHWKGTEGEVIDRPQTSGIGVGKPGPRTEAYVRRVCAAANAQKFHGPAKLATDNAGQTYVQADARVWGRHLNADLLKIGF